MKYLYLLFLLAITSFLIGCSPVATVWNATNLVNAPKNVTFYGLDFQTTGFDDRHFSVEKIEQCMPRWMKSSVKRVENEFNFGIRVNLTRGVIRVDQEQLYFEVREEETLSREKLRAITSQYIHPGEEGFGYVIHISYMTKNKGVLGYGILFSRDTGEIIVTAGEIFEGDGHSLYSFYNDPLEKISKKVTRSIAVLFNPPSE